MTLSTAKPELTVGCYDEVTKCTWNRGRCRETNICQSRGISYLRLTIRSFPSSEPGLFEQHNDGMASESPGADPQIGRVSSKPGSLEQPLLEDTSCLKCWSRRMDMDT